MEDSLSPRDSLSLGEGLGIEGGGAMLLAPGDSDSARWRLLALVAFSSCVVADILVV